MTNYYRLNQEPIGGFLELELPKHVLLHSSAVALNSGRNAFEYILRQRRYKKVFIPKFTCAAIQEVVERVGLNYEIYAIDGNLNPILDEVHLEQDDAILYTNYFGLKGEIVEKIIKQFQNIIIDNSQAFFDEPKAGIDTFYSPRKFFGVPDGGYAYVEGATNASLPHGSSYDRCTHLMMRLDNSLESAYLHYQKNENLFSGEKMRNMSNITTRILQSINYDQVRIKRQNNFLMLKEKLSSINLAPFDMSDGDVPLSYPIMLDDVNLREKLLQNKIFTPSYWPNVIKESDKKSFEYLYAKNLIHLPIDQRYSYIDMDRIIKVILN